MDGASEFIVLLAALLELKSRLMLPTAEEDELPDVEPAGAAEELLARMLDARRYRAAAAYLERVLAEQPAVRYRQAPVPRHLRRTCLADAPGQQWDAASLASVVGGLLALPTTLDLRHLGEPRVTLDERIGHLRDLLPRSASIDFDDAVEDADRMTVAVTLYALLELYKQGEATWTQVDPFSEITIRASQADAGAPPRAAGGPSES